MSAELLTPVRAFNDLGIAAVRRLLERMRKEGRFLPDAIELLLFDPTYTAPALGGRTGPRCV